MVLQTEQSALLMVVGGISYGWFDSEKQFSRGTLSPRTVSVVLEVDKLIPPLRDDSQGVFEKGDNDEEPPNGWEISAIEYFVKSISFLFAASFCLHLLHIVLASISSFLEQGTYGFSGSEMVSNQSSILLVCSRIWSSGLGSLVASARPGPPKRLSCAPRL